MTRQAIWSFLHKQKLAVLSTVSKDGMPDAVPVYYILEKDFSFLVVSNASSKKNQNIAFQSRVVLTIVDQEKKETTSVVGRAEIETTFSKVEKVLPRLAEKLNDKDNFETVLPLLKHQEQNPVIIRIRPLSIRMRRYDDAGLHEKTLSF